MNYLNDENPFGLATPPEWFLTQLSLRDPELVIMPGLHEPVYRLTRRVKKSLGLTHAAMGHDTETARMIRHRLIPVTSIMPFTKWGPELFQWLDDHDLWKKGGADKADDFLLDREVQERAKLRATTRDEAATRGAAAYHAHKMRAGQTVFLPGQTWQPSGPLVHATH